MLKERAFAIGERLRQFGHPHPATVLVDQSRNIVATAPTARFAYVIPKAPQTDSQGDSRIAVMLIQGGVEDSRHAVSSQIARGLFGRGASGFGPAVEDRQPEPTASVTGGGPRRHGPWPGGEDRGHGPADLARLGPPLQRVGAGGPDRQLDGWPQTAPVG